MVNRFCVDIVIIGNICLRRQCRREISYSVRGPVQVFWAESVVDQVELPPSPEIFVKHD